MHCQYGLELIGQGKFPELRWIAIGQMLRAEDEDSWARVEGEVSSVEEKPDGLHMELRAMGGYMRVQVGDDEGLSSALLLNRRIRATGFCQAAFSTAGQKVPGLLLVQVAKRLNSWKFHPDTKRRVVRIRMQRRFRC